MIRFLKNKIFRIEIILLLPVIALTVLFRLPGYIPFTWKSDELDYLSAVQDFLSGGTLYITYGDLKPPLLFGLYALACQVGGSIDIVFIKHMGVLFSIVSVVAIFFVARQLGDNRLAFISALLFALYSICARGEEMLATNSELLMNTFILPAYLLFFAYLQNPKNRLFMIFAGIFLSAGFLINQKAGINLVVFISVLLYVSFSHQSYKKFLTPIIQLLTVFILPIILLLIYYAYIGGLQELYYWLVKMPNAYIGTYDIAGRMARIGTRFGIFFSGYWALLLPFMVGLICIVRQHYYRQATWLTLLLYLFFSTIAVIVGGKMMERYFIQLLPPFIIISAFGLLTLYRAVEIFIEEKEDYYKYVLQLLFVLILLISPLNYLHQHQNTTKPKTEFIENHPALKQIKTIIHANTAHSDKIFVFPKDHYYYYFLQRANATRFNEIETHLSKARMYPEENTLFQQGWQKLFSDLNNNQAKFIIDISGKFGFKEGESGHIRNQKEKLKQYIEKKYKEVGVFAGNRLFQLKT